jgi:glucose-1-phosphate cytidylyltransferase
MKVAILAGGMGTRLSEETSDKPKALVEIGGRPILWHIMMHYAHYGFSDFAIALGYQGQRIERYFEECPPPSGWKVDLVDTGQNTATGGRIKRLASVLGDATFMLTWSDGLSDIDLRALVDFHRAHGKLATVTAVHPPSRFGFLHLDGDRVTNFDEKPTRRDEWINGAFFVLEAGIFETIAADSSQWEREPLQTLAASGELMAYRHEGFWQCMDTVHETQYLEELWRGGNPPWKSWG